jgi:GT2 family glycosyltransferase
MEFVAILLTCHNRKEKTIRCLKSLYEAIERFESEIHYDIYLVDDGCTDGTSQEVRKRFPRVNIISGAGNLYWAGGMRLAWKTALSKSLTYNYYLLLNDDVTLKADFLRTLMQTHQYCVRHYNRSGIYVCSTLDPIETRMSYGGTLILKKNFRVASQKVSPGNEPILCSMANANILMISSDVVNEIGIFDERYTHLFADYDYTLSASNRQIPVLVCPGFGGYCENDHGNNWLSSNFPLRARIRYLYSFTGLSYHDQLYFVRKNFKYQFPYNFMMLWLKTFFPFLWDKFKRRAPLVAG